jgi:cell division transport system ATP-binding protein
MIDIQHISKDYGRIKALKDLNLKIDQGEMVCLVGPSGAGKSTLVRLLTCEEKPTKGRVLIAGRDITKLNRKEIPYFRRRIGVIFQDYKLLPQKTVRENIAYALEVSEASALEIKNKTPKVLSIVGLSQRANNYPSELSGGERQRVSIGRALIHSPKIIIADEPTGNLDPVNTWDIIELLLRINSKGTTIILATHNKTVVDRIKKRVIVLKDGLLSSDEKEGTYRI